MKTTGYCTAAALIWIAATSNAKAFAAPLAPAASLAIAVGATGEPDAADEAERLLTAARQAIAAGDLTGKGHTTRVVGNKPRVTATIHLDD